MAKNNNTLIDRPIKDENCEILWSSLLTIQVCSLLSEEETLEWLRINSPAGTSNNWGLQNKESDNYLAPIKCTEIKVKQINGIDEDGDGRALQFEIVKIAEEPEKTHYIFVC